MTKRNQLSIYFLDKIDSEHVSEHREKHNKWLKDAGVQVKPIWANNERYKKYTINDELLYLLC